MRKYVLLMLMVSWLVVSVGATTNVTYDDLTTSAYMTLRVTDDVNLRYVNEYNYEVYLNGSFLSYVQKDELIFYPDGVTVLIYVPAPLTTEYGSGMDLAKTYLAIALMYLMVFIAAIAVVYYAIHKLFKR